MATLKTVDVAARKMRLELLTWGRGDLEEELAEVWRQLFALLKERFGAMLIGDAAEQQVPEEAVSLYNQMADMAQEYYPGYIATHLC